MYHLLFTLPTLMNHSQKPLISEQSTMMEREKMEVTYLPHITEIKRGDSHIYRYLILHLSNLVYSHIREEI